MTDVVEAGPPDAPRRGWVLGGVALLVLGAVAYGATRPGDRRAADRPDPAASAPAAASPDGGSQPTEGLPRDVRTRGRWSAPPLREPTALAVAGSGRTLRVLDVDSGRLTETRLPGRGTVDPVAAIPGGWLVFQRDPCDYDIDAHCPAKRLYAVRAGRARPVGSASTAVPDPDGRSVWLTYFPAPVRPGAQPPPRWLERRTFDGGSIGRRIPLRGDEDVVGVTTDGPVVGSLRPGPVSVLGAAGRRVVLEEAVVVAGSGGLVAWLPDLCHTGCALKLTDVTTATTRDVATLAAFPRVAVHPLGRYVAVAPHHERPAADSVVVYEPDSAREHRLGLAFPPDVDSLTWSPDGWLLVTHGVRDEPAAGRVSELALWRPGLPRAVAARRFPAWHQPDFAIAPRAVVTP